MTASIRTIAAPIALVAFVFACSENVDRAKWQQMSPSARELYVSSLIGGEKAKERKGGNEQHFSRPVAEYVAHIDEAYARGDRRTPKEIFATLADQ